MNSCELWNADRKSVIFITHDLEEAISLSDRVVVLSAGPATHPSATSPSTCRGPRDVSEIRHAPALHRVARPHLALDEGRGAEGIRATRNRVSA
jgi:NitT/TauT family transport system ATP-binding protein